MSVNGSRGLWRVVGVLAIVHVVSLLASYALQKVADLGGKPSAVTSAFVTFSAGKGFAGEYLTCLSLLVFLFAATLLARLVRGDSELSGWLASVVGAAGAIYVAVSLASYLPALGAALYEGHHGAPLATVTTLDHLHWFGAFVSTAVLGAFTLAAAAAIRVSGLLPAWLGYAGLAVGIICLAGGEGARMSLNGAASLAWAAWFVLLGVAALRGPRQEAMATPATA
jgi:hypothetical protein